MPDRVADASVLAAVIFQEKRAYDATYLHVARTLGVPLVTFDRDLRAAAQA